MRLQRRFRLGAHATVDGIVEVFNLFNHANYGSYVTAEVSPAYGRDRSRTSTLRINRGSCSWVSESCSERVDSPNTDIGKRVGHLSWSHTQCLAR